MNLPDVILEIVKKGCEVTIKNIGFENGDIIVFDIHTDAKSHLYIEALPSGFTIYTRYNHPEFVDDLDFRDVVWRVMHCLSGRDYISDFWNKEIEKLKDVK